MANFTVVNWPPLTPVTSTRLQQMMDNDQHLKDIVNSSSYGTLASPAKKTANQAGITTEVVLSSLTVAGSVEANRILKISLSMRSMQASVAGDIYQLSVKENGGIVGEWNLYFPVANLGINGGTFTTFVTPSAGAVTYVAYATRIVGTGSGTIEASATGPATLIVEDIGSTL